MCVEITVTTPGGVSAANAGDQFNYVALPNISFFSPRKGPIAGGTQVTANGENLTGATSVMFGSIEATSFVVVSSTEITAVAPAGSAGNVALSVTTAGGTAVNKSVWFRYEVPATTTTTTVKKPNKPDKDDDDKDDDDKDDDDDDDDD
jgi:hypothetical protein